MIEKTVFGIGCVGEGKYCSRDGSKMSKDYTCWSSLMARCYSENYQINYPTYHNCKVKKEWHNYQNFAEWYEGNYVKGWELDKDILVKGNKVYSSETCCFVPKEINYLFTKRQNKRGKLPMGVTLSQSNKFLSRLSIKGKKKHIGVYQTPEEAFYAYKKAKEKYIKEVAEKWKGQIADNVYQAMINWKVEITD